MELQAELVHAEVGRRVVRVQATREGRSLGSALGEAPSAEEAEDRARQRLLERLAVTPRRPAATTLERPPAAQTGPDPAPQAAVESRPGTARRPALSAAVLPPSPPSDQTAASEAQAAASPAGEEPPVDPDDWSSELLAIERQLQRLGWQREQEVIYLQRAFGHPSRSRLTSYSDLLAYLRALESLGSQSDPATAVVPLRRQDLLAHCDELLSRLDWQPEQGRRFLEQQLGAASRSQLNDQQLLQFNMLLEGELLTAQR
ncbi:MAG: hypothetical protein VKI83_01000 [Synechococcaceae cyanobacterium]|nr:hypothetical protein [Synechococcaceae cyanobacterium]